MRLRSQPYIILAQHLKFNFGSDCEEARAADSQTESTGVVCLVVCLYRCYVWLWPGTATRHSHYWHYIKNSHPVGEVINIAIHVIQLASLTRQFSGGATMSEALNNRS